MQRIILDRMLTSAVSPTRFSESKDSPVCTTSRVRLRDKIWLFRLQAVERFNRSQVEAQKRSTKVQGRLRRSFPAVTGVRNSGNATERTPLLDSGS